jgi:hypothetical protein
MVKGMKNDNDIFLVAAAKILKPFFTELAVAATITIPLASTFLELTIRAVYYILFLYLALIAQLYHEARNNK